MQTARFTPSTSNATPSETHIAPPGTLRLSDLPEGLSRTRFYEPVPRGLELRIGERLAELRAANERARKP